MKVGGVDLWKGVVFVVLLVAVAFAIRDGRVNDSRLDKIEGPQGAQGEKGPPGTSARKCPTAFRVERLSTTRVWLTPCGEPPVTLVLPRGPRGPQGERGEAGRSASARGSRGSVRTSRGPQGRPGPRGATGPRGRTGPRGVAGAPGRPALPPEVPLSRLEQAVLNVLARLGLAP